MRKGKLVANTPKSNDAKLTAPELVFTHFFDAKREKVFKAWTDAKMLRQWFYPAGFSIDLCEADAKVGGCFRIHMRSPNGTIYPTKGEYMEVQAPSRLVYMDSWDDDRQKNPKMQITVLFEEEDEQTQLSLYTAFSSKEHREEVLAQGVKEGWMMFMDNLTKCLTH